MSVDLSMPVLIVDDYATMLRIVKNLLKQIGFNNVDEATDGGEALQMMKRKKYGLVISDWNMPNCSGLELLKKVRTTAIYAKLPFVLLTAEAEAHQVKEALTAGVSNYIIKPFTAEVLKVKLEQTYKKVSGA